MLSSRLVLRLAPAAAPRVSRRRAHSLASAAAAPAQVTPEEVNNHDIIKVFMWPEWTFRATPGDKPLNLADKNRIEDGISAAVKAKGNVAILVVPGTIFWGHELPTDLKVINDLGTALGQSLKKSGVPLLTYCGTDASRSPEYADGKAENFAGKWAVFNCVSRFGNGGVKLGQSCKFIDSDNRNKVAPNLETWGHCMYEAAKAGGVLPADVIKSLGEQPFASPVDMAEGRVYGVDICADHRAVWANSKSVATSAARALYPKNSTVAMDMQIILANYMSAELKIAYDGSSNIRVKMGGFVVECNGLPGFVLDAAKFDQPPARVMKVTAVTPQGFADAMEVLPLKAVYAAGPVDGANGANSQQTFKNAQPWAMVSEVLDLPPRNAPPAAKA